MGDDSSITAVMVLRYWPQCRIAATTAVSSRRLPRTAERTMLPIDWGYRIQCQEMVNYDDADSLLSFEDAAASSNRPGC